MKISKSSVIIILIVTSLTVWMLSGKKDTNTKTNEHDKIDDAINNNRAKDEIFFQTEEFTAQNYNTTLIYSGNIVLKEKIDLYPEVTGKITHVQVKSGDKIKKDETIIVIDKQNKEHNLEKAKSNLVKQKLFFDSISEMYRNELSSKFELENAKIALDEAKSALIIAERELNNTTVKAPINGYVHYVDLKVGDLLNPQQVGIKKIATVVNPDKIYAHTHVAAKDLKTVKNSIEAYLDLSEYSTLTKEKSTNTSANPTNLSVTKVGNNNSSKTIDYSRIPAKINFISDIAEKNTNTYMVELTLNLNRAVKTLDYKKIQALVADGQNVKILIKTQKHKAYKVKPSILTLNDKGELGVKALDKTKDNTIFFQKVEILGEEDDNVLIGGFTLPEKINIITMGQAYAKEGNKLNI